MEFYSHKLLICKVLYHLMLHERVTTKNNQSIIAKKPTIHVKWNNKNSFQKSKKKEENIQRANETNGK